MLEITYKFERTSPDNVNVHKFVDDEPSPVVYHISNRDNCDCPGCVYHRTRCKHLSMFEIWEKRAEPPVLFFFRDGKMWIRHPEDPNAQ